MFKTVNSKKLLAGICFSFLIGWGLSGVGDVFNPGSHVCTEAGGFACMME